MIDLDLRDPNLVRNVTAIRGLQELGLPDREIQGLYNAQLDIDKALLKIPEMEPIITLVKGQMHTEYENGVMKAVQSYGFDVDKDRLLQALTDARAFYEEGYRAAMGRSKWISVKERLPQEWEEVLVQSSCGFVECAVYIGIPGKWRVTWNHDLMEMDTITHWMPLPEPPM